MGARRRDVRLFRGYRNDRMGNSVYVSHRVTCGEAVVGEMAADGKAIDEAGMVLVREGTIVRKAHILKSSCSSEKTSQHSLPRMS